MANTREDVYRAIAKNVMKWFYEDREGIVCTNIGTSFDVRLIDYCLDVEAVLRKLSQQEVMALELVHRDGLTHKDATAIAGVIGDPDDVLDAIESRVGELLQQYGLSDLGWYLGRS
jgi:hypothetical protein